VGWGLSRWSKGGRVVREPVLRGQAASSKRCSRSTCDEALLDPTVAYCMNPGEQQRYDHPYPHGDDCTALSLDTGLVASFWGGDPTLPRGPQSTTPQATPLLAEERPGLLLRPALGSDPSVGFARWPWSREGGIDLDETQQINIESDGDGLHLDWDILNSITPLMVSVDGDVDFTEGDDGFLHTDDFANQGRVDRYPQIQVYQYLPTAARSRSAATTTRGATPPCRARCGTATCPTCRRCPSSAMRSSISPTSRPCLGPAERRQLNSAPGSRRDRQVDRRGQRGRRRRGRACLLGRERRRGQRRALR
jgi:hypothetical protein